jgi:aminopeptidase N
MVRRVVTVAVSSLVLALSVAVPASAAPVAGTPGASGIGDPYYPLDGNGGYDVGKYGLAVRYDPSTDVLTATATITAVATQNLSRFDLDFEGLQIRMLAVDGTPARYRRDGGELVITPPKTLAKGGQFAVVVTYDGVPQTIQDPLIGPSGFIHTDDGALVVGQPDVAATWFPANDHPRDAALFDIRITVPQGLQAVSNGALLDKQRTGAWTTWHWQADKPMATYLAMMAIGHFDLRTYQAGGLTVWDAVDPDLDADAVDPSDPHSPAYGQVARGSLAREPEILNFLSGIAGPYPFRTSGGVVDDTYDLLFALENQTRPVYSPLFFTDPVNGDDVVVHELMHQWYGDNLRLYSWKNIWLNEGFATYAEWLWFQHEGLATTQEVFDNFASIPADDPFWHVTIGDPGTDLLFDISVYYRGAMALHALRQKVGDPAFFRILRTWATTQAGNAVTIDQFIALAEKISGRQLDNLFKVWLFTPRKPAGLPEEPSMSVSSAAAAAEPAGQLRPDTGLLAALAGSR